MIPFNIYNFFRQNLISGICLAWCIYINDDKLKVRSYVNSVGFSLATLKELLQIQWPHNLNINCMRIDEALGSLQLL